MLYSRHSDRPPRGITGREIAQPAVGEKDVVVETRATRTSGNGTSRGTRKRVFSTHLPPALIEEIRDCVVALSGPPDRLTVSTMVEAALRRELTHRKRKAGRKVFPRRRRPVRSGRPVET